MTIRSWKSELLTPLTNMQEFHGLCREIFGPILPIVEVEDVHEAIQIVGDRYAFPKM